MRGVDPQREAIHTRSQGLDPQVLAIHTVKDERGDPQREAIHTVKMKRVDPQVAAIHTDNDERGWSRTRGEHTDTAGLILQFAAIRTDIYWKGLIQIMQEFRQEGLGIDPKEAIVVEGIQGRRLFRQVDWASSFHGILYS